MGQRRNGDGRKMAMHAGLLGVMAVLAGMVVANAGVSRVLAAAGTCSLFQPPYSVTEGDLLNIPVNRQAGTVTSHVQYSFSGGNPGDYSTSLGSVEFSDGAGSAIIPFQTSENLNLDGPRTVTVTISEVPAYIGTPCVIGSPSTAEITIQDDDGPQPAFITNVTPESGNIAGGTLVTITGSHFEDGTMVDCPADIKFGGTTPTDCTGFTRSDTQIVVEAPAHAAGTVSIELDNGNGLSSTAGTADDFLYANGPVVQDVNPASGTAGVTTPGVVITGEGFTGTVCPGGVTFGGTPVASCTVNSDTMITATAPARPIGMVNVIVTNGTASPNTIDDDFEYIGTLPAVTSLAPASGPIAGGTVVVITGTNLTGATSVLFGATAATTFNVNGATQITATAPGSAAAGVVNVRVTTPAGDSVTTGAGDDYTYTVAPAITSLTPKKGPSGGGSIVVIAGTGFLGVSAVKFGTTNASAFTVDSAGQITATTPPHAAGTVDVTVTNASGTSANTTSDDYEFVGGPSIESIDPVGGPTTGGTQVTINGFGLLGATAVKFGATAAATFTVNSDTKITATSPAHAEGIVDITVTAPGGTTANTLADDFAYGAAAVSSISPNKGPASGGTIVTIHGTNFIGATAVKFGNTPSTSFVIANATQITAVAPPSLVGEVHVTVTTPAGTSLGTAADLYTYLAVPVITSISPDKGPEAGGTTVFIYGKDFTGTTSVAFGIKAATSFQVVNDSQITAVAPPNPIGAVAIRVTSPKGTSAANAASQYTYKSNQGTTTYDLAFRWNLRTWGGIDNVDILAALSGTDSDPDTNNISGFVTAVYYWTGSEWLSYFPGAGNVPGANTLFTLRFGQAYWIAVTAPAPWTVESGP